MDKIINLDNAATTKLTDNALEVIKQYLTDSYGNPSSIYSLGRSAKKAIEEARGSIACAIGADPAEIYFTGGGTESDNWAVKSSCVLKSGKGRHIITSKIEHPAVLNTVKHLEKCGYEATYLDVDKYGFISLDELQSAIRDDTVLITIMTANNEIGTLQPISEIGSMAAKAGVLFHTDAVQAVGHIPMDLSKLNVDMMSFSGHKLGALKGIGGLYIKKGMCLPPLIHGGGQEKHARAGTENVAGIVSMAAALSELVSKLPHDNIIRLRDKLINGMLGIPKVFLTGDPVKRLPGIASFTVEGIEGESMLLMLDRYGICASSGSACSSGSLDPSHVLLATGLSHETAHGSLRFSLCDSNTDEEIDYVLGLMPEIINKLRAMSPLWNG